MSEPSAHRDLIARPVAEVTGHPILSVRTDVLLGDVLATMVRTRLRHLAVVDSAFTCVGVVGGMGRRPSALAYVTVGRIHDSRPSVAGADATIGDVAEAMYVDGVDAVAVISLTVAPIGMITGGDLVAVMAN